MHGGVLGLTPVETARWGGFPLTIMLSTIGLAVAFPLSILVALGRRSRLPGIRTLCVLYVELIRGVPLISVLFMASFMFPLFMPAGWTIDVLVRVQVGHHPVLGRLPGRSRARRAAGAAARAGRGRRLARACPTGRRRARSCCRNRCGSSCRRS